MRFQREILFKSALKWRSKGIIMSHQDNAMCFRFFLEHRTKLQPNKWHKAFEISCSGILNLDTQINAFATALNEPKSYKLLSLQKHCALSYNFDKV